MPHSGTYQLQRRKVNNFQTKQFSLEMLNTLKLYFMMHIVSKLPSKCKQYKREHVNDLKNSCKKWNNCKKKTVF